MARKLSWLKIEAFYNTLAEWQNEDGYVIGAANGAGVQIDISQTTASWLPLVLEQLGCIKLYTRVVNGKRFTLIKIISPLTDEMQDQYNRMGRVVANSEKPPYRTTQ